MHDTVMAYFIISNAGQVQPCIVDCVYVFAAKFCLYAAKPAAAFDHICCSVKIFCYFLIIASLGLGSFENFGGNIVNRWKFLKIRIKSFLLWACSSLFPMQQTKEQENEQSAAIFFTHPPQNLTLLRESAHSAHLMSLLEIIMKAKSEQPTIPKTLAEYPIVLNPDPIFPLLKSDPSPLTNIVNPITGWQISTVDFRVIESNSSFFKKLQRKLRKPKTLTQDEFLKSLNSFLEQIMKAIGLSVSVDTADPDYTRLAIEKMGLTISRDVAGLIAEACLVLGLWELLDALIAQGLITGHLPSSDVLVEGLIRKNRADLSCSYVRAATDIQSSELLLILKYFLSPPKESKLSLVSVRKEWERQAMLSIDRAAEKNLSEMKSRHARQAAILLMMAHDGFSANELCLHYLLASRNVHGLALSWAVARLDGLEVVRLVKYLGKWLRKYEKFPEAGPCPEAATWGLEACKWVPAIEAIIECLGSVLDEHLLYLTLYSGLHEELRSIEGLVRLFNAEAGLCCSLAFVIERMRKDAGIHGGGEIGEV